jgi:hypothetical protein
MQQEHSWYLVEDMTHDDAADGILVVQVRRLRAISREIPVFATREEPMKFAAGASGDRGRRPVGGRSQLFSCRAFPV